MRIGYLVPEFPGQTHAFFWREQLALQNQGCEVTLLSTRKPPIDACAHAFRDEARRRTSYLLPPGPLALTQGFRALASAPVRKYFASLPGSAVKRIGLGAAVSVAASRLASLCAASGVEHLHVHSCANAAHVAAVCHLSGGPPFSLTLHGDLDVYGDAHAQKFAQAKFVSVVTEALRSQVMERLGRSAEFLPVIRMGVDTAAFAPRQRTDSSRFLVVTVARLNHTKGHVYALEAVRRLVSEGIPIEYKIAGSGPEEAAIRDHIGRLELAGHVEMLGSLAEDGVKELLGRADAFLLTSFGLGEAAPVSVMEAMASGVPVVSSRIGGTAEMIDDGVDGCLVGQRDVDGIASALRSLAADPALCRALAERARVRAQADFDFNRNAARLLREIQRVH